MTENDSDRNTGTAAVGHEPLLDAAAVMCSWSKTWPRVIARVWALEYRAQEKGQKTPDNKWYRDLFSMDWEKVMLAFVEEGFLFDNYIGNEEGPNFGKKSMAAIQHYMNNIKILVIKPGTEVILPAQQQTRDYNFVCLSDDFHELNHKRPNGWKDVDGIQNVLVMTVPNPPKEKQFAAIAMAEYDSAGKTHPFTVCS